jgi:nucleoside-diphosphate-sugar epimerase
VSRLADSDLARRPWAIIGCGYTGTRLARRLLAAGASVHATRRTPDATRALLAELGDLPGGRLATLPLDLAVDAAESGQLATWLPTGAFIVDAAPPVLGDTSGEAHLIACARARDARRIVYVSSTGVYPPGDGSWTDEDAPVGPASDQGQARLAAERTILDAARSSSIEAVALRAAGIYGPGRGVPTRLHQGTYRIIGEGDTFVSRIHVDDLVAIILAAATVPSLPRDVYNVADDEPETSRAYAFAVADILGVPRPPSVPASAVDPWISAMMRANRRIANQRLKQELGVALAYPTWREGLAQVMAEEGFPGAGEPGRPA